MAETDRKFIEELGEEMLRQLNGYYGMRYDGSTRDFLMEILEACEEHLGYYIHNGKSINKEN
jgi:hypothetical protein